MESKQRDVAVLHRRLSGASLRRIAEELGITHQSVQERLDRMLTEWRKTVEADRPKHVAMELARLDAMLESVHDRALEGDMAALDRCLRIMERRARYLGLDAPERQEQILSGDALRPVIRVVFDGTEDDAGDAGTTGT